MALLTSDFRPTPVVAARVPDAKALGSPREFIEASVGYVNGYGINGAKPRPWNYHVGMRQYQSWAFAAANKNAHAVAGVPLRLYVHVRPDAKPKREFRCANGAIDTKAWTKAVEKGESLIYDTRPVSEATKRYLKGHGGNIDKRPSDRVWCKAVEFGGDIEEVMEPHPALALLKSVNKWWNGWEYTVLRILDLQIAGNSYLLYITDPRTQIPDSVWRMPPQWTAVIPDPTNTDLIAGYSYGANGNEKVFVAEDVTHFRSPNPGDMYYGKGWFEANWTALGLHNSKREEDTARHDNMSRPDWLLAIKNGASPEILKRLQAAVEERLRGTDKAGKFLAVGGDVSATALNLPPIEAGTPTRIIEEFAAVSGVPVAMLLSNDPTKASSQVARLGWYRDTVHGYCLMDEEKLNEKHLPRYPGTEDMILAYDPVAFEDRNQMVKEQIALVAAGIRTPNQANVALGYVRQDDPAADQLYAPAGSTGGAAAVVGDLAVGQNDERRNEEE